MQIGAETLAAGEGKRGARYLRELVYSEHEDEHKTDRSVGYC
jgi:hypothetical protein